MKRLAPGDPGEFFSECGQFCDRRHAPRLGERLPRVNRKAPGSP
jgi:hypothetical protein